MTALSRDPAFDLYLSLALAPASAVAGGAGNGTQAEGVVIDLQALPARFEGIVFGVSAVVTLAKDKALTVTAKILTSDDGAAAIGDWTVIEDAGKIIDVTAAANGTFRATGKLGVDLSYAKQFVRVVATPQLSAANTDKADLFGQAVFSGADRLPVA